LTIRQKVHTANMGQSTSLEISSGRERLSNEFDFLHEQIRKHSMTLRQLTTLTYDELQSKINELNELSSRFVDCNGKQLVFEMKDGTETHSVLWKGLVRIRCMKTNPTTRFVERYRDLNLKQFLQVYNTMSQMQGTLDEDGDSRSTAAGSSKFMNFSQGASDDLKETSAEGTPIAIRKKPVFNMSASLILDELESPSTSSPEECCICMESKPEVSLPCAHSYCLACIEQWNVNHKTCPICREKLETTDETWVLEDKPNTQDVNMEIRKSLFELTK